MRVTNDGNPIKQIAGVESKIADWERHLSQERARRAAEASMSSTDPNPGSPGQVTSVQVTGSFVEIEYGVDYYGAEGGYNRHVTTVRVIVDKLGHALNPVWEDAWTQIGPGIETRGLDSVARAPGQEHVLQQSIRIRGSACPVHMQFHHTYDYVDYEGDGQHSSYDDWRRYEAADSTGSTEE